jgi:starch synthase
MTRTTRPLTPPARARTAKAPITRAELDKAARILRSGPLDGVDVAVDPHRESAAPAPPLRADDLKKLRELCARYGAVHDLDVGALASRLGRTAATNLERLYGAVQKLKASGELRAPNREETVTDAVLQRLAKGDLTPRVARGIQKTARLELLKLFTDPVKDKELQGLLKAELKKSFRVDAVTLKEHEVPPDIPLRERNARSQNALLALLFEPGLSADLKKIAVEKLAARGTLEAVATLKSFAAEEPALAGAVKTTIARIEKASKMTIVFASMEVAPYAFAGGLGNVMAELPKALARMGHRVLVVAPRHTIIDRSALQDTGKRLTVKHPDGTEPAQVLLDVVDGVEHYFVENGKYFSDGRYGLYGDAHGSYGDVAERYDFFSMAIPEAIKAVLGNQAPDIVQLNDAHTAPAAAYLKSDPAFPSTKTVMAIHNLGGAYQGKFSAAKLAHCGFKDMGLFHPCGPAEFYGDINFLKLGLVESDASIAVSRQYMREILDKANGEGLEGVLRMLHAESRLWGNLNGIDTKSWDPSADPALPARYSFADQAGKAVCKAELQKAYGLPVQKDTPLIGAVSRITDQKGIDDIVKTIDRRMAAGEDVQFVVCGQGDAALCAQLADLAKRYPKNVAFDQVFTKSTERRIIGGSDLFLMPSRFEPCGLPQMYAMRYLTVPIVRAVGGLQESVQAWDAGTKAGNGFKFGGSAGSNGATDVDDALDAALAWHRSGAQQRAALIRNCALTDFSWEATSAAEQVAFFRSVIDG